ncbi:FHA domain-containing protein [Pseudoclavibacter chungangensis]|uniref:FHA domain-containing protein n=2 Tax=Pseudoclavibacter chungangensis TaxID=587635 RepID=A0A7J5BZE2_9MICO|nr:FHA domain-containing protein [Pseudoclavibacter chungangensis]
MPQYVRIVGSSDISRNHVRIEVTGGVVVVSDLHSRNGTDIVMPGRPPQRLRAGEPTAVMPGTVVDLGSGIAFTVRR